MSSLLDYKNRFSLGNCPCSCHDAKGKISRCKHCWSVGDNDWDQEPLE